MLLYDFFVQYNLWKRFEKNYLDEKMVRNEKTTGSRITANLYEKVMQVYSI